MPLILPGNVGSATAATTYSIDNSCRFNGTDSTLTRTPGSAGNVDKWTLSLWLKRGWQKFASFHTKSQGIILAKASSGNYTMIRFQGSGATYPDAILIENYVGAALKGQQKILPARRDVAAWYHFVFVWDSGNATPGDRMKTYANGTEVTTFGTDVNPDADQDSFMCGANEHTIGDADGDFFQGYMAEIALCDGQTLAASDFGEFDSDSPTIWKPKDISGLTFGTTGFYLDFADSGDLGDDESGNGNDFAENNIDAIDQCVDSPTNNVATLNSLDNYYSAATFTEGDTQVVLTNAPRTYCTATVGLTAGKWYWEQKFITNGTSTAGNLGVTSQSPYDNGANLGEYDYTYAYDSDGDKTTNNSSSSYGDSFTANDIIGVAFDVDNLKVYFAKNGTWQNSGDPTSGATGTGAAFTVTAVASTKDGVYFPAIGKSSTGVDTWAVNFGNPAYANSSDVGDANGYGKFEYEPPSGYLAICTKNLGSDGG